MKQTILSLFLIMLTATTCSAQTVEQVAKELARQGVPHSKIVLAQARLESGNMKSAFYNRTNNLFGIKHNGQYATYKHWRESISDYKKCISSLYTGGNYFEFLRRIKYASDKQYIEKLRNIIKYENNTRTSKKDGKR